MPTSLILTVRDTAGIARIGEVVRSGVPLPRSLNVRNPAALTLVDAAGVPVPAEFEVLARWDAGRSADAPIQWLLVTFPASAGANSSTTYRLVTDGSAGPNPTPTTTVSLTQVGNQVTVNTGPATFRLGGDPAALFDEIRLADGTLLVSGSTMTATVTNTLTSHTTTRRVAIEHAGPLAAVVVVEGTYDLPPVGGGALSSRRRYVFTAGSPVAIVRHAVNWEGNLCGWYTCPDGSPNAVRVQGVRDALTLNTFVTLSGLTSQSSLRRDSSEASVFQRDSSSQTPLLRMTAGESAGLLGSFDVMAIGAFAAPAVTGVVAPGQTASIRQHLRSARTDPLFFEVSVPGTTGATGEKADGGVLAVGGAAGTVAVALNHMHRYEPQALRLLEDGRLAVDIADEPAWLATRQGLFATFAVAALPAGATRADLDRRLWVPLNRPLRAWPAPAWFAASDAVDELPVGSLPAEVASYDALVPSVLSNTLQQVDAKGLAGLMTFGVYPRYWGNPVYGDELDCSDNDPTPAETWDDPYWCATWTDYHNTVATAPTWAMRSGQVEWLDEIAFPGALRTLHTQIMQCSPEDDWFYCGQAPAGYCAYRMDFNGSHAYFDNLFLYYWLTGDYTVVETLARGASTMRDYLCSRRPAEPCLPDDPPADEWAHLSGRVASQWFAAFRFVGLAGADAGYLEDYRSGLARAVTQHYVEVEQSGTRYGFWLYGGNRVDGPGTDTTSQLWMASLYDMNNLYRLQRDTADAAISNPAIPPSQVIAAWARTLVDFGSTVAGDGTAGGAWPNALDFTWSGERIGGTLASVVANLSGGDPYLYDTGKATLTALLLRAGQGTGDPPLVQMGADLTDLALNAALNDGSPLGKIQGLYLSRLHAAVARLAGVCPADVTGDGVVNVLDVQTVAVWWGRPGFPPAADLDRDGDVDLADLQAVAGQWGQPCPLPS
jgi:hypothetical protein